VSLARLIEAQSPDSMSQSNVLHGVRPPNSYCLFGCGGCSKLLAF